MDNYRHNWYVQGLCNNPSHCYAMLDSMQFAREIWFADMKAKPDKQQIDAYVNDSLIPIMYLQEAMKHQARVNPNYRQNNLPAGI